MKRFISILISAAIVINSILWAPIPVVSADEGNKISSLPVNSTISGNINSETLVVYEIEPEKIGQLTITVKAYTEFTLTASFYNGTNSSNKLIVPSKYDIDKGYSVVEINTYVNPTTYYLELSYLIYTGCDYELTTQYNDIVTSEGKDNNNSSDTAITISNNRSYLGVLAFDDKVDYYKIKLSKKTPKLKLQVSCIDDNSVKVSIYKPSGEPLIEGRGYKDRPFPYEEFAEPGTYIIKIVRNDENVSSLNYKLITGNYIKIKSISIPSTKTINIGSVYTFKPKVTPSGSNGFYTYESSNPKIVKVNEETGRITALKTGTVTITVITVDGNKKDTCKVTVKDISVSKITLNKTKVSLYIGSSATLTATISPSSASKKPVTWTSSNTKVATVNAGKVTAVGTGTCTITATADGKSSKATIEVKAKPKPTPTPTPKPKPKATPTPETTPTTIGVKSIDTIDNLIILSIGQKDTFSISFSPENATNKSLSYDYNSSIIKIDGNEITALAIGNATITVSSKDNSKAVVHIIVRVTE